MYLSRSISSGGSLTSLYGEASTRVSNAVKRAFASGLRDVIGIDGKAANDLVVAQLAPDFDGAAARTTKAVKIGDRGLVG